MPKLRITPMRRAPLLHVLEHMRARDRVEVFACRWDDDVLALAREIMACQRSAILSGIARLGREPVALFGAYARTPSCLECALIATDRWSEIVGPFTRWVFRDALPRLQAEGFTRAEARALAAHRDARAWLTRLGAHVECTVPSFGRHGEDFVQLAMEIP